MHCQSAHPDPRQDPSPNVILITLDTTRADRMGFLGSQRGLTPNLDALARQSVVFTHAYSQVPLTTASHATILTGTYPQFHQVNDFGVPLAADLPYAPYIFRGNGYHTAAFVGSLVLDPEARSAPGFERGFDTYDAGFHRRGAGRRSLPVDRAPRRRSHRARARLANHASQRAILSSGSISTIAHDPYDPPEPYKTRYASAPYDGEIAYVDCRCGQVSQLGCGCAVFIDGSADRRDGRSRRSPGRARRSYPRHFSLRRNHSRAAAFQAAAGRSAGTRIDTRAGLVDVLPTMLQTAGIASPARSARGIAAASVQAGLRSKSATSKASSKRHAKPVENSHPRPIVQPTPRATTRIAPSAGVRCARCELESISSSRRRVDGTLRPNCDPKAEHNLSATSSAVTDTLGQPARCIPPEDEHLARKRPKWLPIPDLQERLNALGYVASDSTSVEHAGHQGHGRRSQGQSRGREPAAPRRNVARKNALSGGRSRCSSK